jgi:hypothetical protein
MENKEGNCIEDTYYFLMFNDKKKYRIIHAIVERRSDRFRHPHAVIYNTETGDIHEVSNKFKNDNIVIPFKLWLAIGNVSNVKIYRFQEINSLMINTRRWGFYHLHHIE